MPSSLARRCCSSILDSDLASMTSYTACVVAVHLSLREQTTGSMTFTWSRSLNKSAQEQSLCVCNPRQDRASYLQARDDNFGLGVCSQGMHQAVQFWAGVLVDGSVIVGVCEDDLLCQPTHMPVPETLRQDSAKQPKRCQGS